MAQKNPIGKKLILEALEKFPETPSLTLARKLYNENPEVWIRLEAVRSGVRLFRGAAGVKNVSATKSTEHFRAKQKAHDPTRLPLSEERIWRPFLLEGKKIAILSDIHIPYHSMGALKAAIAWLKKYKPDVILLNGDTIDFYQLSRFEKDPRERSAADEIKSTKQFLDYLSEQFPNARIIWKDGNHDERYQSLLRVKAPELLDIPEFRFPVLMDFANRGITYITDKQVIEVDENLSILHGHEFRESIMAPVNAARGLFLRAKSCAIAGHLHQTSEHTESTVQGKMIATWSTGCLCDLHPKYMPINRWNLGFCVVTVGSKGFEVDNKKIIDSRVV